MRSGGAAGGFSEIVDRPGQLRFRRIGVDVEDEELARVETREPELTAVVGEPAMVRFVAAIHGDAVDDFGVRRRARFYIDSNELVCAIAQAFDTERPDIDEFFLAFDAGHVRGGTGFIGARDRGSKSKGKSKNEEGECFHVGGDWPGQWSVIAP